MSDESTRREQGGGRNFGAPVLAVCGFSGSGKTTLLEAAIGRLVARGLSVAVVKHDAHGFSIDKEGKDSDRLFRAGASVALRGPAEQFLRRGAGAALTLQATLSDLGRDHDLLLVEGHKDTPLPKVWMGDADHSPVPENVSEIQRILPWDSDRLALFLAFVDGWMMEAWRARPVLAGILLGDGWNAGALQQETVTRALADGVGEAEGGADSRVVALGGDGAADGLPAKGKGLLWLPPVPGVTGAAAGLLAAHRWIPHATWVIAHGDSSRTRGVRLRGEDVRRLLDERRPGVWAIFPGPADERRRCPLAVYEPQALTVLERSLPADGVGEVPIAELLGHGRVRIV